MKKLLISSLLLLALVPAYAEDPAVQIIGPFGTLNNRDNSAAIPDNMAQDLLNVDITPGGKSFKKRRGYGQAFATTITTSPIHGTYEFYDTSGNDITLAFNDTYLTASVNGASPTVVYSTGPNGATYQCVDSQGFAYCANTSRTAIIKTNGVTASVHPVVSTGTMIAVTPDRLVISGISGATNRIDFSAASDFTSWTTGVSATSAFQFTITAPGSSVKHITYAFNRIMWFKDSSFGYILPGATQGDWIIKTISPVVGTLDNSSVYWQDVLYFRGQDGHIYSYDGSSLQKISKEISGTISQVQRRATNSWVQTAQSDFASGSLQPSVYIDSITTNGSLQLTFPDYFSSLRTGFNSTKPVYTTATYNATTASMTATSGGLSITVGTNTAESSIIYTTNLTDFRPGTTYHFKINNMSGSFGSDVLRIRLSSSGYVSGDPFNMAAGWGNYYQQFEFKANAGSALFTSVSNDNGYSQTGVIGITFPFTLEIYLSTSVMSYSVFSTGVSSVGFNVPIGSNFATFARNPVVAIILRNASTSANSATIGEFAVSPETATYYSSVKNAASLTSWDTLNVTSQNNGGTHSFYMRAATGSFTTLSSTPAWSSVTAGAVPSISTGSYFQFRDDIRITTYTSTPKLDDFTINWVEGNASDKSYATYFNDSILFAVTYGAATTNNRILKYDLLNQGWLIYDIPSNGFYLKNLSLYFGSSSAGYIYKYGDTDNDNGSAINAYWKSKDFIGGDPFRQEEIKNISIYGEAVANSTVTVTLTTNEAAVTSYTIPTYRNGSYFFNSNRNLPAGTSSNSFSLKVGNNAADQPFEIIAERVGLNPKPWNPTSQ